MCGWQMEKFEGMILSNRINYIKSMRTYETSVHEFEIRTVNLWIDHKIENFGHV